MLAGLYFLTLKLHKVKSPSTSSLHDLLAMTLTKTKACGSLLEREGKRGEFDLEPLLPLLYDKYLKGYIYDLRQNFHEIKNNFNIKY